MLLESIARGALVPTALAPLLALAGLAVAWLVGHDLGEKKVARIGIVALGLSFASATVALVAGLVLGRSVEAGPVPWFTAGGHTFDLALFADEPALLLSWVSATLLFVSARFSEHYLHREPGFFRFFLMMLVFAVAMQCIALASNYDQLFLGWELSGISSVLLIAFFYDRAAPVRSSLRALLTYRLSDVGLLLAIVLLHHSVRASHFDTVHGAASIELSHGFAELVAACLFVGAMGKAALFPAGGWLVQAMEGPTPSSALFYGGLSIHAGVFLLLRAAPILRQAPVVSLVLVVMGAASAVAATALRRVQTDAKGALAYACRAQVGLMFVECGLGMFDLAAWHMIGHACLRTFQLLRAPSLLSDRMVLRKAQGLPMFDAISSKEAPGLSISAYAAVHHRFYLSVLAERMVTVPLAWLSRRIDQLEHAWIRALGTVPRLGVHERRPSYASPTPMPGADPQKSKAGGAS